MKDVVLLLNNVTARSRGEVVFEGLTFRVKKGEQWALIGESGAEKSAFLDGVAGKLTISKGELSMPFLLEGEGEQGNRRPIFERWLVAQVSAGDHFRALAHGANYYYQQRFNSADMEESQTVSHYLAGLEERHGEGAWTKNKIIDRLNLSSLLNKRVVMLSSGETKRLLMGAALLQNPVLLLLDHPFMGLDVQTRAELDGILTDISRSGIHIIMATSPGEIPSAITHVAVLKNKKIDSSFPVGELPVAKKDIGDAFFNREELAELLQNGSAESYHTIVDMQDVVVRYGSHLILNGINWKVLPGERWALLGPNGAGKSTLLSLINGDNPQAFANRIVLFDRPKGSGESIWDIKKKIGYVAPELLACFPPESTCLDVIESGFYDTLGLFRISDGTKVAVAKQWLHLFGIAPVANRLFRYASASEQRLCLLVRALVKAPPLLILDEPFQGMDDALKQWLKTLLDAICQATNITLIFVSHYQTDIPGCVNRQLLLENGEVAGYR